MANARVFKNSEVAAERSTLADGLFWIQRAINPENTGTEFAGGAASATDTGFDWTVDYDEILFVTEGTLQLSLEGQTMTAVAGDMVWLPRGTTLRYDFIGQTRIFYAVYPASNVPWDKLLDDP